MSTTESETVIPSGEVLRGLLHQLHGTDEGERLYALAQQSRERDAKFAALQENIAATRSVIGAEITAARQRLVEAQQAANAAAAAYTAANRALEHAGVQLQQKKDLLERSLQALHDEFRGGRAVSPHAAQWVGPPSWATPEPDPVREAETAEERRLRQEEEWRTSLSRS